MQKDLLTSDISISHGSQKKKDNYKLHDDDHKEVKLRLVESVKFQSDLNTGCFGIKNDENLSTCP